METEKNYPDFIQRKNVAGDTKFTPLPLFPKRFQQTTDRPDLPPKPKPRTYPANEVTLFTKNK